MKKEYSENFERDFKFFLQSRNLFDFDGNNNYCTVKINRYQPQGFPLIWDYNKLSKEDAKGFDECGRYFPYTGKEAFYIWDSIGKVVPTIHPNTLKTLLKTKGSVNFHIKMWAESRAEGTLPLFELSKRVCLEKYPIKNELELSIFLNKNNMLMWENKEPVYYSDIESYYKLPEWVINAVEKQKQKLYEQTRVRAF